MRRPAGLSLRAAPVFLLHRTRRLHLTHPTAVFLFLLAGISGCVDAPGDSDRAPSTPVLITSANPHSYAVPCTILVAAADPDRDAIAYQIRIAAGDQVAEFGWSTYFPSGEAVRSVVILDPGTYSISARCRDTMNRSTSYSEAATVVFENEPPFVPEKPAGDTLLFVPKTGAYRSRSDDIEGDQVAFRYDPGNGDALGEWSGFASPRAEFVFSHHYAAPGVFGVRVQAKDTSGNESGWSDPLRVVVRPNAELAGSMATAPFPVEGVIAAGGYAYLTLFASRLQIVDVRSPAAPIPLGSGVPAASGAIAFGPHGVIAITRDRLVNYDVSDPTNPRETAGTSIQRAEMLAVRGNLAAVSTGDPAGTLVLLDVSRADTLIVLGSLAAESVNGIALAQHHAYLTRVNAPAPGEFVVVNTESPGAPHIEGTLSIDRSGPVWTAGAGYAYYISNVSLKVVDVGQPTLPRLVRTIDLEGIPVALDGDGPRLAVSESVRGFQLFGLADPAKPEPIARWYVFGAACLRMWCGDDHLYVANFFGGLLIFDYPDEFNPAAGAGFANGAIEERILLGDHGARLWWINGR